MSRKSPLPQSRRHVMIYNEDWDWLERAYGGQTAANLGPGVAIRQLVHGRVLYMRAQENQAFDALSAVSTDSTADDSRVDGLEPSDAG